MVNNEIGSVTRNFKRLKIVDAEVVLPNCDPDLDFSCQSVGCSSTTQPRSSTYEITLSDTFDIKLVADSKEIKTSTPKPAKTNLKTRRGKDLKKYFQLGIKSFTLKVEKQSVGSSVSTRISQGDNMMKSNRDACS